MVLAGAASGKANDETLATPALTEFSYTVSPGKQGKALKPHRDALPKLLGQPAVHASSFTDVVVACTDLCLT